MISRLRQAWRLRPRLTAAFLLACALTLFFFGRFVAQTVYWSSHRDMVIEPWMTVGYIARSWSLDPRAIEDLSGLPPPLERGRPKPLSDVAKDLGVPVDTVIEDIEAAIIQLRAQQADE